MSHAPDSNQLPTLPSHGSLRLLFVCMGNICRSPAAECMMRHLAIKAGQGESILCDSAGTIGYHSGAAPDPRMRAAGRQRGLAIEGSARQISRDDFDRFDLILVMDKENLRNVTKLAQDHQTPVRLLCDFTTHHDDIEVPDPYYGGDAGFEHVLDLVTDACAGLLAELTGTSNRTE
ncbi:low molecular weight protein-tyrosine-phosphatase [Sulfuriroseicoccus oceanibius]|uniref:Low molecular weight phosphotyrosine protein phosphatase n=1 Tax=Sulfuriroseicoccus oceanibius TaxID=2707525 RepID=A0A6B3LAK8_9BACT|nr:low molecular weight protein-tyrosine-phosphatase [Sulfuriroseicoccus oceanibius]QQL44475.1 low molecular weight phosphotyrosine protein phosphatase [Sulfuriroseicoccus oceanibius]